MVGATRREATELERAEQRYAELDRRLITWHGRTFIRNDWLACFLGGLPVGALLAAGLSLAGRGGFVVVALLQLALLVLPVVFVALLLVSSATRRWGRGAAFRAVHLWGGCLGSLLVLRIASSFMDSGMRDAL